MNTNIVNVPLERITDNPYQLRTTYDPAATQELASSISTNGLLQPPLGRIVLKGQVLDPEQYGGVLPCLNTEPDAIIQLVFGHRRKRAYEHLNVQYPDNGWKALPIQVCQFTAEEMGINAHVENEKREDLDPIEEAMGIRKLRAEFHWTQAQAAKKLGLSRPSLANKLRLLKLPQSIQDKVHSNALSERQALAVLPFFTLPAEVQEAASQQGYGKRRLQDGIKTGESSTELRQRTDWAIRDATVSLDDVLFPLNQVCVAWEETPAVRTMRCTDCPLLVRYKGEPLCGDRKCRNTKQILYLNYRVCEAAAATLLPANQHPAVTQVCTVEEANANSNRADWTPFRAGDEEHLEKALETGCPHLHLAPALYKFDIKNYLHPLGYTDVYYVCRHKGGCACRSSLDLETAEAEAKAAAQQEKIRKRELGRLKGTAINTLAIALERGTAWRAVAQGLRAKVKSAGTQALFQALAKKLIEDLLWKTWQLPEDPEEMSLLVDQWLARYVNAYVSEYTALEIARRRFEPIQTWYDDLAHESPDYTELYQRTSTLEQILRNMEQDVVDGAGDTLKAAITDMLNRLVELRSNSLLSIPDADFKQVSWLFSVPPGDVNFKGALEKASLAALRYVLILVRGQKGQKTRAETLQRQIRKLEKQESATNEAS